MKAKRSSFFLEKWYLDFIGNHGETMIFYAAELSFNKIVVQYASCIHYHPGNGLNVNTHFRKVSLPKKTDTLISWTDKLFGVSGSWKALSEPLHARLLDNDEGYIDWNCFQPSSRVKLKIKDRLLEGKGYAEQLVLTAYPWDIPMDCLQWGRFHSPNDTLVWIEIRKEQPQQWVWLNGEKLENCNIADDRIASTDKGFELKLDRGVSIESEQKIFQVVQKLLQFLPGFDQLITPKFLMAANNKWLSKGNLHRNGHPPAQGMSIHETINFGSGRQ